MAIRRGSSQSLAFPARLLAFQSSFRARRRDDSHDRCLLPHAPGPRRRRAAGTQTLMRGLAVVQAVADGARDLKELCARIGVARSTAPAGQLPGAGTLSAGAARRGLCAGAQADRTGLPGARGLSAGHVGASVPGRPSRADRRHHPSGGARQRRSAVPGKIPGKKGLEMRSRVGHRMPLAATGVGKALLLDADEPQWKALHRVGGPVSSRARRAAGLGGVPRTHARLCGAGLCLRPGRQRAVDPLRGGAGARRLQRHRGRHQRVQHRALYVAGAHGRDGAGGV